MKSTMRNKVIAAVGVLTLGATLAFGATSETGAADGQRQFHRHGHGRKGAFGAKFAEKLGLTDVQKQQIRDIRKNFFETNKPLFEQARATRQELRAAKQANDTAKLDELKPALDAQRVQFKELRAAQEQRVAEVLTPQQRAQWDTLKAERAQRMQERKERRNQ
jgi:periplasmic protein CpxP/Spy